MSILLIWLFPFPSSSNSAEILVFFNWCDQWKHFQRERHPVGTYLCQPEQFRFCIPVIGRIWIRTSKIQLACSCHLTFLKYHATNRFWPHLLIVKNRFKISSIMIRIFTKIESIPPCYTHNLSTKFRPSPTTSVYNFFEISHSPSNRQAETAVKT